MEISTVQEKVDQWISENGVRYFNELTNTVLLMEEVGELARIIARKFGEQSFKEGEAEQEIDDEIADIFFVLVCIANQTGVDLEKAFIKNIDKKTKRDSLRHKKNPKLSND